MLYSTAVSVQYKQCLYSTSQFKFSGHLPNPGIHSRHAASKIGSVANGKTKRGNDKAHHYIGTYMTPHEAALNYSRYIGAQQADAEKVAEEASGENRKSSTLCRRSWSRTQLSGAGVTFSSSTIHPTERGSTACSWCLATVEASFAAMMSAQLPLC